MDATELSRWTRFAAKGGIGKCTATHDCVADTPEDLMFLKDDEITVLMQLSSPQPDDPLDPSGSSSWMQTQANGLYLGYCEGVVGKFHGKHRELGSVEVWWRRRRRREWKEYTHHVVAEDVYHNGNATIIIQPSFLAVVLVVEQTGNGINDEQPQSSYTITTAFKLPFPTPSAIIFIIVTFITIAFPVKDAAATVFDTTTSKTQSASSLRSSPLASSAAYANVAEGSPRPAGREMVGSDAGAGRDGWDKVDSRLREAQHPSSRQGSRSPSLSRTQSNLSSSTSHTTVYANTNANVTEDATPASYFVRKTESPIPMDRMPLTGVEAALAALTGRDGEEEEERKEVVDEDSLPNPFITHTKSDSSSSSPSPPPPLSHSDTTSKPTTQLTPSMPSPISLPNPFSPSPSSTEFDGNTLEVPPTPTVTSPTTPTATTLNTQPYNPYLPSVSMINQMNPRSTFLGPSSTLSPPLMSTSHPARGLTLAMDATQLNGSTFDPGEQRNSGGEFEYDEPSSRLSTSRFSLAMSDDDGNMGIGLSLLAGLAGAGLGYGAEEDKSERESMLSEQSRYSSQTTTSVVDDAMPSQDTTPTRTRTHSYAESYSARRKKSSSSFGSTTSSKFPLPPTHRPTPSLASTACAKLSSSPTQSKSPSSSPTSPTFSVHSTTTINSTHTFKSTRTTGTTGSKLSANSRSTGRSGGETDWDGAGDIYDDYMYRYSTRFSMASVATGKSHFGGDGEEGEEVPPPVPEMVNGNGRKGSADSVGVSSVAGGIGEAGGQAGEGKEAVTTKGLNVVVKPRPNALDVSKTVDSSAGGGTLMTPGTAGSMKSTASPLLHTTWGDVLSSPEEERRARGREGLGDEEQEEEGREEERVGIVIDDEEPAPDVSLTTGMMGMGDESFVSDVTTVEASSPGLALPNPYGPLSPPPPPSSQPPAAAAAAATPPPVISHLRPSLADLRGERDPESGLRTSIFSPHPNAPKAPVEGTSKGPLYIQQQRGEIPPNMAGPGGVPFNPNVPFEGSVPGVSRFQSPPPPSSSPNLIQRQFSQHRPPPGHPYPSHQQQQQFGVPPNPGVGPGAAHRILYLANQSRGVLGRGPTLFARCDVDLASSTGPVPVSFSVEPFVGLPPPPPSGTPPPGQGQIQAQGQGGTGSPSMGATALPGAPANPSTIPRMASLSSLRPSPLNPAASGTPPPPQPPTLTASPTPLARPVDLPGAVPTPEPSTSSSTNNIQVDSKASGGGSSGGEEPIKASTSVIPRPNFYPRAGTARPRSRSFSEFGSTTAEVPMPVVGDDTQPLKLKIPSVKTVTRSMTSTSTSQSPRINSLKPTSHPSPPAPSSLRTAYAPSPLSIPPTNALSPSLSTRNAPKSPTSPLSRSPLSESTPIVPPLSPTSGQKKPHPLLRLASSNPSFRSGGGGPTEPRSPGTAVPPSLSRRREEERERDREVELTSPSASSQASGFDGTNSTSDREQVSLRQNSIPDVSIGRSSTSTTRTSLDSSSRIAPPLSSATVPNTPQPPPQSPSHVTRQSSLRSKLSLPNLRRKQSKQPDDTVSIAASSIDASSSINGEPEFEMAQVGGMEFELVRPSFSHFRNSEDSFAGRDRDGMSVDGGGSGSGGLLRADSPAMSYTSSGQRSPSVGDFRLPHTPPPPASSQLPASTMTPSKLSSAPQTFESASTIESHRQRELKWLTLISAVPSSQARKNKKVKRLLMEGEVPSSVRYMVWGHIMDVEGKGKGTKGAYERIVEGGKGWVGGKNGEVEEIEKDVRESGVEVSTQESMVMVMQSYLAMVPDVKYSRGLTHIARNLLSHAPEQDGFWVFVSLMDSYLRPYFSAMTTTQKEVDAMLFAKALENNDPTVAKKVFTAMGINVLTICDYWFSSVFVNSFPSAYLQRIWDVFLFEGVPFLLRIGLAIFTLTRRQILELPSNPSTLTPTPSADVLRILHHPPVHLLPCSPDALITLALSCKFKEEEFVKQRVKLKAAVVGSGKAKAKGMRNGVMGKGKVGGAQGAVSVSAMEISLPRQ
ncbi:hypothetical protein ONZ45_g10348 [Pleurotus djamor]|nr:hypothetical protein ONZ45_g10348 [Pleurotus djamor]